MSDGLNTEDLAARLAHLEDERAIMRTLQRYGHSIDYGLEEDWVDCFTDDGVFDVRARNGDVFVRCEGRDALLAFVQGHTRPPAAYHKHVVVDPMIEISGDSAHVDSYFARIDADDDGGRAFVMAMGRYRDDLVRCPDGMWRISSRLAEIQDR
jgi:SnoaL-like domain